MFAVVMDVVRHQVHLSNRRTLNRQHPLMAVCNPSLLCFHPWRCHGPTPIEAPPYAHHHAAHRLDVALLAAHASTGAKVSGTTWGTENRTQMFDGKYASHQEYNSRNRSKQCNNATTQHPDNMQQIQWIGRTKTQWGLRTHGLRLIAPFLYPSAYVDMCIHVPLWEMCGSRNQSRLRRADDAALAR